ncbi:MAG: hypothetical protein AB1758_21070, partial [Candidatus Eremiobacterota bacterium]
MARVRGYSLERDGGRLLDSWDQPSRVVEVLGPPEGIQSGTLTLVYLSLNLLVDDATGFVLGPYEGGPLVTGPSLQHMHTVARARMELDSVEVLNEMAPQHAARLLAARDALLEALESPDALEPVKEAARRFTEPCTRWLRKFIWEGRPALHLRVGPTTRVPPVPAGPGPPGERPAWGGTGRTPRDDAESCARSQRGLPRSGMLEAHKQPRSPCPRSPL